MARRAFYSFHYKPDNSRASQVRTMGVLEGNRPASDNDWETVTAGGEDAIKRWINDQMDGKSVAIVLIGAETAGRKWITYEIVKAWNENMGLLGIFIHNLKNLAGEQSMKGSNPFSYAKAGETNMAQIVRSYDPPYSDSKLAYGYIKDNLGDWIETAITIRGKYA